jgi:hypothetical protein
MRCCYGWRCLERQVAVVFACLCYGVDVCGRGALLLGVEMPEERLVAAVLEEYAGWQVRDSGCCFVLPVWRWLGSAEVAGVCCIVGGDV